MPDSIHDLRKLYLAGQATIPADRAWPVLGVSHSTFYRSMAAGEVPGVLALGRKRLISLGPFLRWIDDDPEAGAP